MGEEQSGCLGPALWSHIYDNTPHNISYTNTPHNELWRQLGQQTTTLRQQGAGLFWATKYWCILVCQSVLIINDWWGRRDHNATSPVPGQSCIMYVWQMGIIAHDGCFINTRPAHFLCAGGHPWSGADTAGPDMYFLSWARPHNCKFGKGFIRFCPFVLGQWLELASDRIYGSMPKVTTHHCWRGGHMCPLSDKVRSHSHGNSW